MMDKIRKRNGAVVDFEEDKMVNAIFKAQQAVGEGDREQAKLVAQDVIKKLEQKFKRSIPSVEEVQDMVEQVLMEQGLTKSAKAYILYRNKRTEERELKSSLLGGLIDDNKDITINSLRVLKERYLAKDDVGKVIETPNQLFRRVANNIAQADKIYSENAGKTAQEFFDILSNLYFMANSPTLMNAGRDLQQLSACFVLPVEDSMEGIFETYKNAALIHKTGGGTGFAFSRLRPRGDYVKTTGGVASGPVSFMRVFNWVTEVVKQGGTRRGANMGILRVDHPDILEFITAKEDERELTNFNISVAATDKFMDAVKNNTDYELVNPRNGQVVKKLNGRKVFDLIVTMAWKNGDPGFVFIDRINRENPTFHTGVIESTNPCGEQPLPPYDSCNLGSINVALMVKANAKGGFDVDWEKLREVTRISTHFLDNVIDMNKYPIPQIEKVTKSHRRIGLGIMGFADLLTKLNISYDTEEALQLADKLMGFVHEECKKESVELAKRRGMFPAFKGSKWDTGKKEDQVRNATLTTIAPTGTISMIADCSSGIEPLFSICYIKRVMDGQELLYVDRQFEAAAKKRGFYSEELMKRIAISGSVHHLTEIPADVKRIFVTSHDITPDWHVKMQAVFQKHVESAVSKTINFPHSASIEDVETAYLLAYDLGCKGITIYRDQSRGEQVLKIDTSAIERQMENYKQGNIEGKKPENLAAKQHTGHAKAKDACPECGSKMQAGNGCFTCSSCAFSYCKVG